MRIITGLRPGRGRDGLVKVLLDGRPAFTLPIEEAVEAGLHVGDELSANQAKALAGSDRFHRCLAAATRYLGYRPRSQTELTEKLRRRGFDGESIMAAIARLKEKGFIDDAAFARFWKDNRESFSPRSRQMARLELKRKGVADEVIEQAVADIDNYDSAYRAAASRAHRWPVSDRQTFQRRAGEYLRRRGFSYEVINQTVSRLWREQGAAPESKAPGQPAGNRTSK
ncbi:MAG: regulatory protein RecX [Chloroflexota bacterium]